MKIRYQAFGWAGKKYVPISCAIYSTSEEAKQAALAIIRDRSNDSVMPSLRKHYQERPVITEPHYYD